MWFNKMGDPEVADFCIEEKLLKKGYENIAGIDEAGRGALFGPVVAVTVMFSCDFIRNNSETWISEVDDSKLLAPQKRAMLARAILASAKAVGIGVATNKEIDKKNIHRASFEAMRRAIKKMPVNPDFLLVDGLLDLLDIPQCKWESISIDFIVGIPITNKGHELFCAIVDQLAKMVQFIPTKKYVKTLTLAKTIFTKSLSYV